MGMRGLLEKFKRSNKKRNEKSKSDLDKKDKKGSNNQKKELGAQKDKMDFQKASKDKIKNSIDMDNQNKVEETGKGNDDTLNKSNKDIGKNDAMEKQNKDEPTQSGDKVSAVQKNEKDIPANKEMTAPKQVRPSGKQEAPDTTATLQPLTNADPQDWLGSNRDPDVMLSVPNLGIDHIGLNVKNVHAHIDLQAKILDLVDLHVGADVGIQEVDLQINNVRVQAMLKVKLEKVREIVGDVVGLLDHHPEILSSLTGGLGRGLEGALAGKRGSVDQLNDQERAQLRKMIEESDESNNKQKMIEESKNKKQEEH